ncbi:efflux RND transporter permease subunit [Sphingobacterium multivorum]|nr:efflux RND transporter permease subunit [Sphingobacterium multivorum]
MSWNITNLYRFNSKVKEQQYLTQSLKQDYDLLHKELNAQSKLAQSQLTNAYENFEETKVQLSAAQLAYKQHTALYENGLTTLVDYKKPLSILVIVHGLLFFGIKATRDVKVDILPEMNLPVVYIAHSFNGYTPQQMEGYFTKMYVNMMLFANGIKSIESKNTQGLTLMKITFYEGTEMGEAIASIKALSNRSQVFLPPGAPPPFIIRFDASSQSVGQLVFRSNTKTNNQLQDIANFNARPFLIKIPGLTTAPPFGGSPRTIEINIDPYKLRSHNLSPEQVVEAINRNNITSPSGNIYIGDKNYLTPTNNTVKNIEDLGDVPIFKGTVDNVYIRDVATVKDGADIATGYALIDGKRSVYINIAKAGNASTLDVVNTLKKQLPDIQRNMPDDVKISYEFDQSVYLSMP